MASDADGCDCGLEAGCCRAGGMGADGTGVDVEDGVDHVVEELSERGEDDGGAGGSVGWEDGSAVEPGDFLSFGSVVVVTWLLVGESAGCGGWGEGAEGNVGSKGVAEEEEIEGFEETGVVVVCACGYGGLGGFLALRPAVETGEMERGEAVLVQAGI